MPKVKDFLLKYETKIVVFIGLILVSVVSFEFGLIQGKKLQTSPVVIEKTIPAQETASQGCSITPPGAQNLAQEAKTPASGVNTQPTSLSAKLTDCAYVGSKNSNKFHLPTCTWAKRIKPENIVCFKSAEEALAQGRVGDKGCIK